MSTETWSTARPVLHRTLGALGGQAVAVTTLCLLLGCGSDVESGGGGGSSTEGPLYIVGTVLTTADVSRNFIGTSRSLSTDTDFDVANAVETDGGEVFGQPGTERVFTTSWESPVITRWTVDEDGSIGDPRRVSFANLGLFDTFGAANSVFVGEDRAYFASTIGEVVVWDSSNMTVVDTIGMEVDSIGSFEPSLNLVLRVVDDRLLATVHYQNSQDWTEFGDQVLLVVVDLGTHEVTGVETEERCNFLVGATANTNGDLYYSPPSFYAPPRALRGPDYGADPCVLRVRAGTTEFDTGFSTDLSQLLDGRPAGDLRFVDDDFAFVRVWHPELVTAPTETNWEDVRHEAGFRWWTIDFGANVASEVVEQTSGAENVELYAVEGRVYTSTFAEDFSTTTLTRLGPDGELYTGLTVPGALSGVFRLR